MSWVARWLRAATGRAPAPAADERRWVVLDVETTGLDMRHDHLLAIAAVAVHFDHGLETAAPPRIALADSFEIVLRHESRVTDKDNILLHGIGVGAQRAGVPPQEALNAFEAWIGSSPLIAFHAAFDQAMIGRAMHDAFGHGPRNPWLDLAPVARALFPEVGGRALDDWLEHFGIECAARHEAAADTLATAELLMRLWPAAVARRSASFDGLASMERNQRWLARS